MAVKMRLSVFMTTVIVLVNKASALRQDVKNDIMPRLDAIEGIILDLQKDKEGLRLDNKKLHMDNAELRSLLRKLRQDYELDKEELSKVQTRLENAEQEIVLLKTRINTLSQQSADTTYESRNITSYDREAPGNNVGDAGYSQQKLQDKKEQEKIIHKKTQQTKSKIREAASKSKRLLVPAATAITNTDHRISFSAHMSSDKHNLGDNQAFLFETVNNNEGGAYDKNTGAFSCLVSGTYYFTVHILAVYQDQIWADLVIDGAVKSRIYAGGTTGIWGTGSNSLIIHCNKNEDVWVKHQSGRGNQVGGGLYSHFAGFLLWADQNTANVIG